MESITVLGSTGSIGKSTLDVLSRHPDRYRVFALTANSQIELLVEQCVEFNPQFAVVADSSLAQQLEDRLNLVLTGDDTVEVLSGVDGLERVASDERVDQVMAAIVGAAGMRPTIAAIRSGKRVLLANKESLVMSGAIFMHELKQHGAELLPIDSEHNAIFQCMPGGYKIGEAHNIEKILLTGSGGPFRERNFDTLDTVTPAEAIAHPNWSMGSKISVDSATMMNKGLEFIEACWLFGVTPEQVEVVIHPQSIIHSMVQYRDGSLLAQMGNPDMRTPIAHALSSPERIDAGVENLDLFKVAELNFERPDFRRYPCLQLAIDAMSRGGSAPTVLNAANEVAVSAFLAEDGSDRIGFMDIAKIVENSLEDASISDINSLDDVLNRDSEARIIADYWVKKISNNS
ncbi:MAG: 1-deoxy-D-xylulose-5-phosphate reductoisomerase [Thiotrichales bacterium]|nr:1-deoxy-D-xylulose-5-phosphate reductoisomerase [Thiotrichales bacterium]MBT3614305.1 1-deoxy-D-xylulose-5-phosphate reductoisomerase [Thiotrichales bacterium]MBT3752826.1 1-deoxy-D-xylulose-5-phosphate reductoisomerase [Thiotrichales bacterium]MBT3837964.1 1-deoxy-D-xylulose-5-phosphate reductoisomerase [Thiotrichales bacterium]MBT4152381.1 1-deoxy-D-xylulose-5-phosphate reductoisomerase [Thiotrichales bacterium]